MTYSYTIEVQPYYSEVRGELQYMATASAKRDGITAESFTTFATTDAEATAKAEAWCDRYAAGVIPAKRSYTYRPQ